MSGDLLKDRDLNVNPFQPHEVVIVGVVSIETAIEANDRQLVVELLDATARALYEMRVSERYSPIELATYGLSAGRVMSKIDPLTIPSATAARFTRQTALSLLPAALLGKRNPGVST